MFNRGRWLAVVFGILLAADAAQAAAPFRFEDQTSVEEMRALVLRDLSQTSTRDQVRRLFVDQGRAALIPHPRKSNVEKYIYDINLCGYYVWRWNISTDYRSDGQLKQLYVNAEPVLAGAQPNAPPKKGPFYRSDIPRPQAYKGEASLAVIFADRDGDLATADDREILTGVGPTRADPLNMGRAHSYRGELWRSIFDGDDAREVAPYPGDCAAVDDSMRRQLGAAATPAMRSTPSTGGRIQSAPRPTTSDGAGVRLWLTNYIKSEGWTPITADETAVVFGGPAGVTKLPDGTLRALVRHEYFARGRLGTMDSQSNLQTMDVDCNSRRVRIIAIAIYEGSNLSGASMSRISNQATWNDVKANSTLARTLTRICDAPVTGQQLGSTLGGS